MTREQRTTFHNAVKHLVEGSDALKLLQLERKLNLDELDHLTRIMDLIMFPINELIEWDNELGD
jgi:hypothetical protein